MEFDFKITTWERVKVGKEDEQKVLDGIKDGTITCASDICNMDVNADCQKLDEVDEQISVEENGGSSTIEVMVDGELLYTNGE